MSETGDAFIKNLIGGTEDINDDVDKEYFKCAMDGIDLPFNWRERVREQRANGVWAQPTEGDNNGKEER